VLAVRHVLGCGGSGFRISIEENGSDEGHRFESEGIPIVMDNFAAETLNGAVIEIDSDPAGDGYRLDHPAAVLTTFC
jgi:Fe-S cluster assembly iron-binding protein IscA